MSIEGHFTTGNLIVITIQRTYTFYFQNFILNLYNDFSIKMKLYNVKSCSNESDLESIAIAVTSKDLLIICNVRPGASRVITDLVA